MFIISGEINSRKQNFSPRSRKQTFLSCKFSRIATHVIAVTYLHMNRYMLGQTIKVHNCNIKINMAVDGFEMC